MSQMGNQPEFQLAKVTIPFEADTTAVDARLDAVEQRLEELGEKFGAALTGAVDDLEARLDRMSREPQEAVVQEIGEPVEKGGMIATPVQLPPGMDSSVQRDEELRAIRAAVEDIRDMLRAQGAP